MADAEPVTHDPRYPIGTFALPEVITEEDRRYAVRVIAELPEQLYQAVRGLDEDQLNTPYRQGGWTVRQLVHHIADSHMIAFDRLRRGLTENWPEVRGYDEKGFAQLPDAAAPVEWSLEILENVHARWITVLQSLQEAQWQRGFRHNERGLMRLDEATLLYAWHSRHHVAHITHLRTEQGW